MRNRYWDVICWLPSVVAVLAVGLTIWITPTREQCAIANLVKMHAHVALLEDENGSEYMDVDLHDCEDNDDALRYVPDIEKVEFLRLASAPVHEAGIESILRMKGLRYLDVTDARLSADVFSRFEHELRRANPNLEIGDLHRKSVPLDSDE